MSTKKDLIKLLEESFAESSPRRPIGRLLLFAKEPLNTKQLADMSGYSMSAVTSGLEALGRIFQVNRVMRDGRYHYSIQAPEIGGVDVPSKLTSVFSPLPDDGYLPNGYWKGNGYGSIQLA